MERVRLKIRSLVVSPMHGTRYDARPAVNYLAHLLLSNDSPDAITGAMLGDFVKGRITDPWSPAVRAAIELHRAIDGYTDRHPVVVASRALISVPRRRFGGILVDVFFDHFLARHWRRYHDRPLAEFTRDVYAVLLSRRSTFPDRLQRMLPFMAKDDWLASYADLDSIAATLNGMARRFRFPERARELATGVAELREKYVQFELLFEQFMPQAQAFAAGYSRPPDV